ncbi:glutathione gamma-glutamylcysteinyltransferase 2 isoform X2 [Aplysia californica]|nr:glutathione gamma-glutamylcysteinyltransferase 2 isoform X2 [Aplysia californica]
MALNALEIDPGKIWKGSWRWYHEDMLDCCTPLDVARVKGINMEQFVCLARCNGLNARARIASAILSLDELRQDVLSACSQDDLVFISSYSRKLLEQTGDGHFSPVAGYHKDRDLVLILDTARFKYPPHWIPLQTLWDAMNTVDKDTGKVRGYVLLSRADSHPSSLLFRPSCDFAVDSVQGNVFLRLKGFSQEWFSWMKSPLPKQVSGAEIVSEAVDRVLDLMKRGQIPVKMFCSNLQCTQWGGTNPSASLKCCPSDEKDGDTVSCILHKLLKELSSLETFQYVETSFTTKLAEEKKMALGLLQSDHTVHETEMNCCNDSCCSSSPSVEKRKVAKLSPELLKCSNSLTISPEHMMTLFLLVWPHKGLWEEVKEGQGRPFGTEAEISRETFGDVLVTFLSNDVQGSTGSYIASEIKSVKYKLEEVMKYHGFSQIGCCGSTKQKTCGKSACHTKQ